MYRNWSIYAGIVWSVLFAIMSFYWAAGGMLGVETLGGEISQKAIERESTFIMLVWVTGIAKLGGVLLLLLLLKINSHLKLRKIISRLCIVIGALMFLYGLANFITISLAGLQVLNFDLSAYAMTWRLLFWEPFWMLGGILYLLAGANKSTNL